jgi:hypothetical protein
MTIERSQYSVDIYTQPQLGLALEDRINGLIDCFGNPNLKPMYPNLTLGIKFTESEDSFKFNLGERVVKNPTEEFFAFYIGDDIFEQRAGSKFILYPPDVLADNPTFMYHTMFQLWRCLDGTDLSKS